MSQGRHRAARPKKTTTIRRIAAGLSIAAATATGGVLANQAATAPADSAWGAPDTTTDTGWGTPSEDSTVTTNGDSGWG